VKVINCVVARVKVFQKSKAPDGFPSEDGIQSFASGMYEFCGKYISFSSEINLRSFEKSAGSGSGVHSDQGFSWKLEWLEDIHIGHLEVME